MRSCRSGWQISRDVRDGRAGSGVPVDIAQPGRWKLPQPHHVPVMLRGSPTDPRRAHLSVRVAPTAVHGEISLSLRLHRDGRHLSGQVEGAAHAISASAGPTRASGLDEYERNRERRVLVAPHTLIGAVDRRRGSQFTTLRVRNSGDFIPECVRQGCQNNGADWRAGPRNDFAGVEYTIGDRHC